MKKVLVIGGGASGLVAASIASLKCDVTLMERNSDCGKKLLMTGNGKCNYWNEDISLEHFHSYDEDLIKYFLDVESMEKTFSYLKSIGIIPYIKNGYYYPFSNQAITIKNALVLEAKKRGVSFFYDTFVEKITKKDTVFEVVCNKGVFFYDAVILATGSKTLPKTGSDGNGYQLARCFSHTITDVNPSLVQLISNASFLKKWAGIRTKVKVSLYENNEFMKSEYGEAQLTDYGISGICVFNLSRDIRIGLNKNKNEVIHIHFLPFVENDVLSFLEYQNQLVKKRTISELLEGILNYKLVDIILSLANLNENLYWNDLSNDEKIRLCSYLEDFKLTIVDTKDFLDAQVSSGGVSLKEINIKTMESKLVPGLFLVGEMIDIDGDCGGYNLMNAFITGLKAGEGVVYKYASDS